jgi:hypothetical protein
MPKASDVVIGGLFPQTPLCPVVQLFDKPEQIESPGILLDLTSQ